jgi:hypothetical protein
VDGDIVAASLMGFDVERVHEAKIDDVDGNFRIVAGLELVPCGLLKIPVNGLF